MISNKPSAYDWTDDIVGASPCVAPSAIQAHCAVTLILLSWLFLAWDVSAAQLGDVISSYPLPSNTFRVGPGFGLDGTAYAVGEKRSGQVTLTALSTNGQARWSLEFPDRRAYGIYGTFKPGVIRDPDGDLTFVTWSGVAKISAAGSLRWLYPLKGAPTQLPVVAPDGTVMVTYSESPIAVQTPWTQTLLCLDPAGRILWKTPLPLSGNLMIDPAGRIVGGGSQVERIHPDGSKDWSSYSPSGEGFSILGANHFLHVVSVALPQNVATFDSLGQLVWQVALPGDAAAAPIEFLNGVLGIPTTSGHFVGVLPTGSIAWDLNLSSNSLAGVTVSEAGNAYLLDSAGTIHKVSSDGVLLWQRVVPENHFTGAPVILNDGKLLLCPGTDKVTFLAGDGSPAANYVTASSGSGSSGNFSLQTTVDPPLVAPQGLQASDNTLNSYVALEWKSVAGAQSYELWKAPLPDLSSATKVVTINRSPLHFDDTEAKVGVTNFYWVRAVTSTGVGPFSSVDAGSRKAPGLGSYLWSLESSGGQPHSATASTNGVLALVSTFGPLVLVDTNGVPTGARYDFPSDASTAETLFQCQALDGRILLLISESEFGDSVPFRARMICLDNQARPLWTVPLATLPNRAPAITPSGEILVPRTSSGVGSVPYDIGGLSAFTPQGNRLWDFQVSGGLATSPTVLPDETILFQGVDRILYHLSRSGAVIRSVELPELGRGRPVQGTDGYWWIPSDSGYLTVSSDFKGVRAIPIPNSTGLDEAMFGADGTPWLSVAPTRLYQAATDGSRPQIFASPGGLLDALGDGDTAVFQNATGLKEISLSGATLRVMNTPSTRVTATLFSASGSAVFGTADGRWWAVPTSGKGPAKSPWPMRSHDPRFSGAASKPLPLPGTPSTLTLLSNAFTAAASLQWPYVPNAEYYNVYRRGPADPSGGVIIASRLWGQTNFVDVGGTPGTTNEYWIAGENSSGIGAPSRTVTKIFAPQQPGALLRGVTLADAIDALPAISKSGDAYISMRLTNRPAGKIPAWGVVCLDPYLSQRWFREGKLASGSSPMVSPSGDLILLLENGLVVAVDAGGKDRWTFRLRAPSNGAGAIDAEGNIFIGSKFGASGYLVTSIDSSGRKRWESPTSSSIESRELFLVGDGHIILGANPPTRLPAAITTQGEWIRQSPGDLDQLSIAAIGLSGEGVGFGGGQLVGLNSDGSDRYQINWPSFEGNLVISKSGRPFATSRTQTIEWLTESKTVTGLGIGGPFDSLVVGEDDILYASSLGGVVRAFTADGQPLWTSSIRSSSPTILTMLTLTDAGLLYLTPSSGEIFVLKASSGSAETGWPCVGGNAQRTHLGHGQVQTLGTPTVAASYGLYADGIHLTWPSVTGAYVYDLLRSETPDPLDANVVARGIGGDHYVDSGVAADSEYYYFLVARNRDAQILSTNIAVGLRREPQPGDTLWEMFLAEGLGDLALDPNGELRAIGSHLAYGFNTQLEVVWLRTHEETPVRPVVVNPAGELIFRAVGPTLQTNRLVVLDRSGSPRASWDSTSSWITEPAVGSDGTLYLGTAEGDLVCLNATNAAVRWSSPCGGAVRMAPSISARGTIIVTTDLAGTSAFSSNGAKLWNSHVSSAQSPVFDLTGQTLLVESNGLNLTLRSLQSSTGEEAWSAPISVEGGISVALIVGPENRLEVTRSSWFDSSRTYVTQGFTPGGPLVTTKTIRSSGAAPIFMTQDGLLLELSGYDRYEAAFVDRELRPHFTFRVNPGDLFLDDFGRLLSLMPGSLFRLQATFVGSPLADTAWTVQRGDQQRSGRAAREVRPMLGEPVWMDGKRIWPLTVEAAVSRGSVASLELFIDGSSVAKSQTSQVSFFWSGDPTVDHELRVLTTESNGGIHSDGPWFFHDTRSILRIELTEAELILSAPTLSSSNQTWTLQSSLNLRDWVSADLPSLTRSGSTQWHLPRSESSTSPKFFRVITGP